MAPSHMIILAHPKASWSIGLEEILPAAPGHLRFGSRWQRLSLSRRWRGAAGVEGAPPALAMQTEDMQRPSAHTKHRAVLNGQHLASARDISAMTHLLSNPHVL